jgi:phosphoglycolate phosphatase
MSLPDAILFDWDNTLVDTWPCITRAMNTTLEAMGHDPWTEAEAQRRIARSLRESFPDLFGGAWQEAAEIFYRTFAEVHIEMLSPLRGAAALLDHLAEDGVLLAVVSNKTGRYLREEADHLGWTPYFHRVVGAGDAPRDKPSTDVVRLALKDSGIDPSVQTVWFVGDMPVDMQCGHDSGCKTVLLRSAEPDATEFLGCEPSIRLSDPAALLAHMRELKVSNARV